MERGFGGHPASAMFFFPLRALVAAIGWFAFWMEIAADAIVGARRATAYVRTGACNRCGRCCRLLALEMPERLLRYRWLVWAVGAWHDGAMNFEPQGETGNMLVYRCRYYREGGPARHSSPLGTQECSRDEEGGCAIYPFRHRLCRLYPRQGLFGHPELPPECGFRFIRRDVLARCRALRKRGVPTFDALLRDRLQNASSGAAASSQDA
jgi:uncharacterized protein